MKNLQDSGDNAHLYCSQKEILKLMYVLLETFDFVSIITQWIITHTTVIVHIILIHAKVI